MDKEPFVGRQGERRLIGEILADSTAALVAVYGRRRVGKTFLVRRATAEVLKFELTGIKEANLREQLENFSVALAAASGGRFAAVPRSWLGALEVRSWRISWC